MSAMRIAKLIGTACGLALTLAAPSGALAAAAELVWGRAVAPNGDFSIETVCTEPEIAASANMPNPLKLTFVPQSRVVCAKEGLLLMAASWEMAKLPAGGGTLYDVLWAQIESTSEGEARPVQTTINGRRAITNRAKDGDVLAQTGFIEIGPKRLIVLVAGGQGSKLSFDEQGRVIDRFFASTKVMSQ